MLYHSLCCNFCTFEDISGVFDGLVTTLPTLVVLVEDGGEEEVESEPHIPDLRRQ